MTRNIREASATTLPTIAVVAVLLYVVWNMPDTDRTKLEAVVKLACAVVGLAVAVSGAITAIGIAVVQARAFEIAEATLIGGMTGAGALLVLASTIRLP